MKRIFFSQLSWVRLNGCLSQLGKLEITDIDKTIIGNEVQ